MKQIQFSAFGQPSLVARCVEAPDVGSPSAWEVIVEIEAFPINVADLAMLSGNYGTLPKLPSPIGMEAVGRVIECGSAVQTLAVGDRVVLLANNNWAERRKVPVSAVHKVSAALFTTAEVAQLSLLKVNPATAYMLLNEFVKLEPGDWVIQTAPLSSVGQCVMQLAQARGLKTVNVIHRADLKAEVMARGGDVVLEDGADLAQSVRAAIGYDPIRLGLDAVAGSGVQRLAECLSEGSQIINYGMLSGESCVISADQTIFRGISLQGFWLSKILNRLSQSERTALFDTLSDLVVSGKLAIDIDSYFPIAQIDQALRRAEQGNRKGKVIVVSGIHADSIGVP
jgi:mitochondrial enoyl-[acyl-carrier protein] reductase / trans-2-enoyl-CoA reductase